MIFLNKYSIPIGSTQDELSLAKLILPSCHELQHLHYIRLHLQTELALSSLSLGQSYKSGFLHLWASLLDPGFEDNFNFKTFLNSPLASPLPL